MPAPRTAPGRIGQVLFKQETVAGEAIANPSTFWPTAPKKPRAWDIEPEGRQTVEDDPAQQPNAFGDPARIVLGKEQKLGFKCYMPGLNQTAVDATPVTSDDLGLLLKAALGTEALGTTTKVSTGNTGLGGAGGEILVDSITGLAAHQAVMINGEARRIVATLSGPNRISLDMDLSAAPAPTTLVKAAANYLLNEAALVDLSNAGHLTFAAFFRGYDSEDQWQFRGCHPEVEIADIGDPTKALKLVVNLLAMDWELVSGVAVNTLPTDANPPAQVKSGLYINPQGTATLRNQHTKSLDVKLGLKKEPIMSPVAQQGVAGHAFLGGRTTLEFEAYYDSEWQTWFESRQKFYAGFQVGSGVLITLPEMTIDEAPVRVGQGATSVKVKMHADVLGSGYSRVGIHRFAK